MKIALISAVIFLAAVTTRGGRALADPPNPYDATDTIRYLLSKSALVVIGTTDSGSEEWSGSSPILEPGIQKEWPRDFVSRIRIESVLFGPRPKKNDLLISIYRVGTQNGETGIPIESKHRYIFFLKRDSDSLIRVNGELVQWSTSDIWFGAYPFDSELAREVAEFAKTHQ